MLNSKDDLSAKEIKQNLLKYKNIDIVVKQEVTSTNNLVKEMAELGHLEGRVVVANSQTHGRGRFERDFFSPCDTGIYMSVLLRPKVTPKDTVFITVAAAVAVAKAIDKVCRKRSYIKWVNDIFIDNKKVCGILCESSVNLKTGKTDYVVLGIGINLYPPQEGFPHCLEKKAGFIFKYVEGNGIKNKLIAKILDIFFECYYKLDTSKLIKLYKKKMFLKGKKIYFEKDGIRSQAVVKGVDDKARLVVLTPQGEKIFLSSGEVTAKEIE